MKVDRPQRILLGATSVTTVDHFVAEQASFLAGHGLQIHIFCDGCSNTTQQDTGGGVFLHHVPMRRSFSPIPDIRSLIRIVRLTHQLQPDTIFVGTPKAGLLGLIAGVVVGVSRRVYLVRGLRLEGLHGLARRVSHLSELVSFSLASEVVCVSPSLRDELLKLGRVKASKVKVLGAGSSHGVDTTHFRPPSPHERRESRETLNIPHDAEVIGFAGRLTPDKGIGVLLSAVSRMREQRPDSQLILLIAGKEDETQPLSASVKTRFSQPWCQLVGDQHDLQSFYWALDLFCLPSFREGMPNVNLEASASGLPVVTSSATGCRDSVIPGITGQTVEPGDVEALIDSLLELLAAPGKRAVLGVNARQFACANFERSKVNSLYLEFLKESLN